MKTTYTKTLISLAFSVCIASAKAQFGDYKPYPVTVTPHEQKDSTRGHIWGYAFGSAYTKVHADSINSSSLRTGATQYSQVAKGFNAFSLQRVYMGYDYFFNKNISAHALLAHEEFYDGSTSKINIDAVGDRSFYLKLCNVEFDNIFKGSNLTVGAIVTPAFVITEEPIWGYRSLERTILDMRGIVGATDVGANLGGKIWHQTDSAGKEKACVGYNLMAGNSTGAIPDNTGNSGATPFKRYYGDIYVKLLHDKLILDLYADQHTVQLSPYQQSNVTGRALIGYKTKDFSISIEYFQEMMQNQAIITKGSGITSADTTNRIQSGVSIAGAATLLRSKKTGDQTLGLIARYDLFKPDNNYRSGDTYAASYSGSNSCKENFIMLGIDYQPIKQVHVMPNVWYDGFKNQAANISGLKQSDYDLVFRITLYFMFYK